MRRTCIEAIRLRHPCVLLERRQNAQVNRPFTKLHDFTLQKRRCKVVIRTGLQNNVEFPPIVSKRYNLTLTSSVYRMICSESEVYSVATNMRSE